MRQRPKTLGFASLLTVGVLMVGGCVVGPVTPLHYAPNNNFSSSGYYAPRAAGFNLADVSSVGEVRSLPSGVRALVWLGQCNGADSSFINAVQPFIGDPRVFGFYLMDEPDPTGQWNPLCPAANLRAESDWIHAHAPGAKTFIVMMNFDSSTSPTYANTYNPGNSHVDLYGIDPYPCRTEAGGCDYSMIPKAVAAAEATGIPAGSIVRLSDVRGWRLVGRRRRPAGDLPLDEARNPDAVGGRGRLHEEALQVPADDLVGHRPRRHPLLSTASARRQAASAASRSWSARGCASGQREA